MGKRVIHSSPYGDAKPVYCEHCQRLLYPEVSGTVDAVSPDGGEVFEEQENWIFIHDDVPHPDGFSVEVVHNIH